MSIENNLERIRHEFQDIRVENIKNKVEIERLNQELRQRAVFQDWNSLKKVFKRTLLLARVRSLNYFRNLFVPIYKSSTKEEVELKLTSPRHPAYQIQLPLPGGKKRVKILHAIPTFTTGGSQQLVVDLIENLSEEYEHVVIVAARIDQPGYEGRVTITQVGMWEIAFADKIDSYIKSYKPDILHVHFWATKENWTEWNWYNAIFEAGFRLNIKVIENCNNPTFPFFDDRILKYVYVSNYTESVFGLNSPQNLVIYPGSNFQKFRMKEEYAPGETIGMVYRLEKDKLNEQSIEPFIQVVRKRPKTKVLIIGGGSWFDFYNSRVREENLTDNFEFTGYVAYDELPGFYRKLSVFVAPVHNESFGQVTPFAMNMGIPVVGYNIGALSEIIDDHTLLATYGDAPGLANIVTALLDNKEKMMQISRRNRELAKCKFSLAPMIDGYRKIYNDLAL